MWDCFRTGNVVSYGQSPPAIGQARKMKRAKWITNPRQIQKCYVLIVEQTLALSEAAFGLGHSVSAVIDWRMDAPIQITRRSYVKSNRI